MAPTLEVLPIDGVLPEIAAALRSSSGVVVCAPPGAGKTTRVPRALYDAGYASSGDILILEPRRLAARLAATRVASELGEQLGNTVGFSIRFESVGGPGTRIRFLTEGILARRIVQDPLLAGVSIVILDEFHERHLTTDLALAFLRRLQCGPRRDLKVVVMSATLDAEPIAGFLGGAPIVTSSATRFEVSVAYEEREVQRSLHERVMTAVSRLLKTGLDGDVLVFLPGAAEIRMAAEALQPLAAAARLQLLPLHGDLPASAQARVVEPSAERKLILSTNVAESSVTIPGVTAVIDSGLARVAGHSAWSGLPVLSLRKVSKASVLQRAGRAGRTRDGRVVRLFTRHDFESRPERDLPEIKRADLAESVLTLHGAGVPDLRAFTWFESPPEPAVQAAENLLARLGAIETSGKLTETGRQMIRFPVHPRIARLIVEGGRLGVAEPACLVAALLNEREIRLDERSSLTGTASFKAASATGPSDLLELLERFRGAEAARFDPHRLRSLGLDPRAVEAVERARRQLSRLLKRVTRTIQAEDEDQALMIAILAAFPDRVARRRGPGAREFLLAAGGSGRLAETSVVHQAPLIVAVDAEERTERKNIPSGSPVLIRRASAVESEWLAALFPDEIIQRNALSWNESAGRVEESRQTLYGDLVLEETVRPAPPSDAVSQMLFEKMRSRGLTVFCDGENVAAYRARIELLAEHYPTAFHPIKDEEVTAACAECCAGQRSLADLSHVSLIRVLQSNLTSHQKGMLEREAPVRITLPGGRKVPVHYEPGRPPWIESALQDFVGLKSTPALCSGRVPLTVHLLAPNRRPVQVTQDLQGFWERHYPSLRRQLQRRYPKHHWPD